MLIQIGKATGNTSNCKRHIWRWKIIMLCWSLGIYREETKHTRSARTKDVRVKIERRKRFSIVALFLPNRYIVFALGCADCLGMWRFKRSRVHLPGDEEADDLEQEHPADTETEAESGRTTTFFQKRWWSWKEQSFIIFISASKCFSDHSWEDWWLRDVQTEHSNKLTTMQDQINLLTAKFDSFTNQH